ncbi:MAG: hypothetical protein K6G89_09840 [Clostridia bacterium]|nr:hypothetical protein [Clostridia bacterium]
MKYYPEDREFVNENNYYFYCNTNEHLLQGKPAGIAVEFPGLGGGSCLGGTPGMVPYGGDYAEELASKGILLAYIFTGPWSWMNDGAVRFADCVVNALRIRFGLEKGSPLVSTGGSMGGLGSLIFAAKSGLGVTACAAVCPCVDPNASVFCDNTVPRSFVSTFCAFDMPLREAIETVSPIAYAGGMPSIPYLILADEKDELFPLEQIRSYSDMLLSYGNKVSFMVMENCGHGGFTEKGRRALTDFVIENGSCSSAGNGIIPLKNV